MEVPKVNAFTTQPLNHLTTQLLPSFVVVVDHECLYESVGPDALICPFVERALHFDASL